MNESESGQGELGDQLKVAIIMVNRLRESPVSLQVGIGFAELEEPAFSFLVVLGQPWPVTAVWDTPFRFDERWGLLGHDLMDGEQLRGCLAAGPLASWSPPAGGEN